MPALTTLEQLRVAVQRTLDPLPLIVEPDADVAVRESLNSSGLLLLGECHGVAENPLIIRALLERFDFGALALEWDIGLRAALEAFLFDGELGDLSDHIPFWCGDGRISVEHLALLRALAQRSDLGLILFDGPTKAGWSVRDATMAKRLLPQLRTTTLVVAGKLHARLDPHRHGTPLGAHLAAEHPGVHSVEIHYRAGAYFNLGERTFPGSCTDRRRARLFRGDTREIALELSLATAAQVPFDRTLL